MFSPSLCDGGHTRGSTRDDYEVIEAVDDPVLTAPKPGEEVPFHGGLDSDDPRVDPVAVADLTGLPPTTVYLGIMERVRRWTPRP